jgi:hypothetical protein
MRIIITLLFLFALMFLSGCKSAHHLRRAEHFEKKKQEQIQKAIDKGAKVRRDSVMKNIKFKVPGVKVEFTPKIISDKSLPLIFIKDSVITKVIFRQGINGRDTVFVATDCPDQEVSKDVAVAENTNIEAKQNWTTLEIIGGSLLIAVIFFLIGRFFKVIQKLITLV